jgi:2-polyprenyl-3-methyl-5-hydroxy-6-metoxy-1,4-benzoquinol methylase
MVSLPTENIYSHTKKLRFILSEIDNYRKMYGLMNIKILDFGCGNGIAVSQYLMGDDICFYGIDVHEPCLEYARANFGRENVYFMNKIP